MAEMDAEVAADLAALRGRPRRRRRSCARRWRRSSASTTGAAPSWRSTCAAAPTPPCTASAASTTGSRGRPAGLRPSTPAWPARSSTARRAQLAVEVGDRIFQLAFEDDDRGDPRPDRGGHRAGDRLSRAVRTPRELTEPLREQVAAAARRLAHEGLLVGTAGNVSARAGDRVAVTASGVVLAGCRPEDVTVVSLTGDVVEGELRPTSELSLHLGVYADSGRRRGRAHACAVVDRGRLRARRAAGRALPAAAARRRGPGGAVRHLRHAGAGRSRARGARGPAGRADGQPRLGRGRRHARAGRRERAAARVAGGAAPPRVRARHPPGADRRGAGRRGRRRALARLRHPDRTKENTSEDRRRRGARPRHPRDRHRVDPRRVRRAAGRDDPDVAGRHRRRYRGGARPARRRGVVVRRARHRPDRRRAARPARRARAST